MSAFPEKFAVIRTQSSRGPYYQFLQSSKHLSGYRVFTADWSSEIRSIDHYMMHPPAPRRKTLRVWNDDATRLSSIHYMILPLEVYKRDRYYPVVLFDHNAWLPRPEHRVLLEPWSLRENIMNTVNTYSHMLSTLEDDDEIENYNFSNLISRPSTPPRRSSSRPSSTDSHRSLVTVVPTADSQSIRSVSPPALQAVRTSRVTTEALPIPQFVGNLLIQNARSGRESCPISTAPYTEIRSLSATSCFHVFETESIERWLVDNTTCPVCRIHVRNIVTQEN